MGRYVSSLHRTHGATVSSSLFFGSWHLYSLFTKMNHGETYVNRGRGVWLLRLHIDLSSSSSIPIVIRQSIGDST